ncbi:acyl-CoA dehydrogenase [Gonapodya prolifera JEL478]|uniref:Acyl-CoA dehydrogenase n=1 Tax=Gonapodya prolifera (strain JEL478) TaxID=1344416 RepID=A0A139AVI9_GONPJ|nr:acyl-CoA dehydrogenase [Gonapodya prolifera JEL478]|eukprot:KXS20714.1 acyl-CoA dehydrogenase [Gonapodya prolifera JEL478]
MPDFLSPDLVSLRDKAAKLADDLRKILSDSASDSDSFPRVRDASKAAGVYELTSKSSTSALAMLVVRETLASRGVGHLAGIFAPDPGFLSGAQEPVRASHLVPVLDGRKRWGLGITEPAGVTRPTSARVDGQQLVINGTKSYVTGGQQADFVVALVEVEGKGPSMVIIDTNLPGVSISRRFSSIDGSAHAAFLFQDVRVPLHNALGKPGQGRSSALVRISQVRLAVASEAVGSCIYILDVVGEFLSRARKGGARAQSERIRMRYGHLRALTYAARATVYRSARLVDSGQDAVNEIIAAKLVATEVAGEVVDTAIQLVGGEALVVGHPLEETMRRLRTLRLAEGETDTLRVNLARGHFDLKKGRL